MNEAFWRSRNQKNLRYISEAYHRGKLSHAYMIEGRKGAGAEEFADHIAAALLCEQNAQPGRYGQELLEPCGVCPSCVKAMSGNHPDIIHVTHEKETVLSVAEIREQVVGDVAIKPYYGPYKIYIIPQSELMNENAQNAILKTMEEPQEYALILLLTDNADGFLPTIKSRCIRIRLADLSREEMIRELLDDDGQRVMQILRETGSMTAVDITKAAKELEGMDRTAVLQLMQCWLRDLLVFKSTKDAGRLYFQDRKEDVRRISGNIGYEALNRMLISWEELGGRLKANVKADAAYETFLLQVRRNSSARQQ